MNVSLTPELECFVQEKVHSGRYTSAMRRSPSVGACIQPRRVALLHRPDYTVVTCSAAPDAGGAGYPMRDYARTAR